MNKIQWNQFLQTLYVGDTLSLMTQSSSREGIVSCLGETFLELDGKRVGYETLEAISIIEKGEKTPFDLQIGKNVSINYVAINYTSTLLDIKWNKERHGKIIRIDKNGVYLDNQPVSGFYGIPYSKISKVSLKN